MDNNYTKISPLQRTIQARILLFLFLVPPLLSWQKLDAQCVENKSFQPGEVLSYLVYYNWGIIWINAGWVKFRVAETQYNNQAVYYLDGTGASHKSYDWLYKVRDTYKTYVDKETMMPLWFHRKNYEGGWEVDNKYTFDWENKQVFTNRKNSNLPQTADTVPLKDCTYDVLSLIYYFRNIEYEGLEVNDTIPVRAIIDNENFDLYIRYLGIETIKDRNGNKYRCRKFSALLVEGTIFKGGEDLYVWATDDENKMPVLVEAKILIGSVKAYIYAYKGLKYPVKAKLN